MVTIEQIEAWGGEVGRQFSPDRVLLFGSYASGDPTPDSDVDILVVMPHAKKGWQIATEIRTRAKPPFACDLLVRTPGQIRDRIELGDCFIKEIIEKGIPLYEAPNR